MEGLEITVLNKSELEHDNAAFRLDSDFNQKPYLQAADAVRKFGAEQFEDSQPTIIHPTEIIRQYVEEGGVWFLRAQNVRPLQLSESDKVYITLEDASKLTQNRLAYGDVLVTRTGANRGDCAYFDVKDEAVASSHTFIVRNRRWSHALLVAFFNCSYGRLQIDKGVYGAAQPEVAPYYLRKIWVPRVSQQFQEAIEVCFSASIAHRHEATRKAGEAEALLLRSLGLEDWHPPEPLAYESTFSQAWGDGRLDAEHYQPKYADLLDHLRTRGAFRLGDRVTEPIRRGLSPDYVDEGDVRVINSQHVGKVQVELEDTRKTTQAILNLNANDKGTVRQYDVLLNSTGYITIGRSQCLLEDVTAVVDNHVAIVRPDAQVDPVYLACFLNTFPGQMQTEMNWTGSSGQIELRPDVVADYLVWDAPAEVQSAVRAQIETAHRTRGQAKRLLDTAKRAVEVAIEDGEAAGLGVLAGG